MEWIIVLDEDWGDMEETGSLCLAARCSQQPHNCQISKTGINHRPQALFLFFFYCLSVSPFTFHMFSHILCPCLLLCRLLSSALLCNTLHCPPWAPSPLIHPLIAHNPLLFFFLRNNAQNMQTEDESDKISCNNTQPNWLVSSAALNLQFSKVRLGGQR